MESIFAAQQPAARAARRSRQYLRFNGLIFAPFRGRPVTGCHGMYRISPGQGVHLYKPDGVLAAYVVTNDRQGFFVVTAHETDMGPRYMYATSSRTEKWLGIVGMGLQKEHDLIKEMAFVEPPTAPGEVH